MASQLAAKQPNRETNRSCGLETPDKCLLLSDRRKQDEYQELIPVWDDEIVKVGRDPLSRVCIEDDADNVVSREHCEVYVVVYDESNSHVYVRDRRSSNGTFVNGVRIGTVESGTSAGYLLEHGDMIEIRPFWTLTFCENRRPKLHRLTNVQETESKLFETKYHISQRCLGQGAEGVVCLATEVETRRQLVCKVVDLTAAKGKNAPDGLRRRLQEADVLRQLQHPNILPYVDAIISPHSLYMFMELATGGDLWSFLYQRGAVSEFETRVIVRQVVRALDYIHHKGVVHRDLKPENILLAYSPNSKCHRIMLSDFGASAVPRRSRMLTHIGTANYQAPEIQGQPQLQTAAVDIWSLGVVALTVLTHHMDDFRTAGLHLLDQARVDAFLEQNVFGGAGQFSSNCEDFVRRCLQVSPRDRPRAVEARIHDWLCTPQTHLAHFRELERRSVSSWRSQGQLRPMPLQLPDVTLSTSKTRRGERSLFGKPPQPRDQSSPFFLGPGSPEDSVGAEQATKTASPSLGWAPDRLDSERSSSVTETSRIDPSSTAPCHGPGAQAAQVANHVPGQPCAAKWVRSRSRINDSALLPLTSLERHLNLGCDSTGDRRGQMLEELKRANAKFLPDIAASTGPLAAATGDATGRRVSGAVTTGAGGRALPR